MNVELEADVQTLIRRGALEQAAARTLEGYGPELYGFLVNLMGSASDADEVYAQTVEDLWRGLPAFEAKCSMRTWVYLLARHAAVRYRRSPWNRGARTGDSRLELLVAESRSGTEPWRQTEVKDRWRALRQSLDPDDGALLVLRIDRDLSWNDIARVMLGIEAPDAADLERETARLRKRFQVLKEELRRRAREAGLVEDEP
jgi:RNA polymerase sigma-70 factor (ECF subfamily)